MLTHRHVEVFRALMIAGSVTRAAELLHTSQPTVSRELARMEHSIGFPLFERIRGRLRPTMQALALYDEVRQSYAGLERVASAAARLRAYSGRPAGDDRAAGLFPFRAARRVSPLPCRTSRCQPVGGDAGIALPGGG